jgi:hypothetical protein
LILDTTHPMLRYINASQALSRWRRPPRGRLHAPPRRPPLIIVCRPSLPHPFTTGIRAFAECWTLCRVPFLGHSTKMALPRAALGNVWLSVTSLLTECRTLGTGPHSAKTCLPSVKHSATKALGKGPSAAVLKLTAVSLCREPRISTQQRGFFAECQILGTQQRRLC